MGKTVMITGAGSGFGKGAALALTERGHQVIATTETEAQAEALRAEAPQLFLVEKFDITLPEPSKATEWDVDVLINNAGAGQTGPLADVDLDLADVDHEVVAAGAEDRDSAAGRQAGRAALRPRRHPARPYSGAATGCAICRREDGSCFCAGTGCSA